jgi:Mg-chelatase subunit ChlD
MRTMQPITRILISIKLGALLVALMIAGHAAAQAPIGSDSFTLKVYHVNDGFYPIVEAYIRTWDTNQNPLVNLNERNIGLQVKGRNYNPRTAVIGDQYRIESIERRREGFRTVVVLDCSGSMRGQPFADAIDAINRFIEAKRPMDQIAILAIRDTSTGYELLSEFTNDPSDLYRRLSDAQPDGQQTRLYDTVAASIQMCATASRTNLTTVDNTVLSTIVILSDGFDEGSAISRSELINRIGTLDIPVPIHSIAFTRIDRAHLRNMEAISTASFGRYFDVEDTSHLARTMERIHTINRSDYVVTFRAYVPVDGESHNFRIGVEYPSDSGHFVFDAASFDAIESPAVFNDNTNAYYQSLMERYPDDPAAAYGPDRAAAGAPDPASFPTGEEAWPEEDPAQAVVEDSATAEPVAEPAIDDSDDARAADAEEDEDPILAMLMDNAPLVGAAVVLLAVLLIAVVWVKRSSRVEPSAAAASTNTTGVGVKQTRSTAPVPNAREMATRPSDDWTN